MIIEINLYIYVFILLLLYLLSRFLINNIYIFTLSLLKLRTDVIVIMKNKEMALKICYLKGM